MIYAQPSIPNTISLVTSDQQSTLIKLTPGSRQTDMVKRQTQIIKFVPTCYPSMGKYLESLLVKIFKHWSTHFVGVKYLLN